MTPFNWILKNTQGSNKLNVQQLKQQTGLTLCSSVIFYLFVFKLPK